MSIEQDAPRRESGIVDLPTSTRSHKWLAALAGRTVDLAALAVALAATLIRVITAYQGFFVADDWQYLIELSQEGLTWERMLTPHGGHFMAGGYAILSALTNVAGPIPWTGAVAVAGGLFLACSLATWWAVRELVGPRWLAVVALGISLTSSITLLATSWFAEWVMLLPVWLAGACSLALLSRAARGSRRAVVVMLLVFPAGLFFMEKALFIPVAVLCAAVAWFARGGIVGSTRTTLARLWPLWLGYLVIGVGYVALVVPRITEVGRAPDPLVALHSYVTAAMQAWPGILFGGPLQWAPWTSALPAPQPPLWPTLGAFVAMVALVVLSALVRRHALRMWAPLAIFAFLCLTAIQTGRVADIGWVSALNVHYFADGTALLACTLAVAFLPMRGEEGAVRDSPTRRWLAAQHHRGRFVPALVAGLTAILIAVVATTQGFIDVWRLNPGREFAQNVQTSLDRNPGVELFDGGTPSAFDIFWPMTPYDKTSQQFTIFPRQPRWVTSTTDLWMLKPDGMIVPAKVSGAQFPRGTDFCGTLVSGPTSFAVPGEPWPWPRVLYIDYLAKEMTTLTLKYGDDVKRVTLPAGVGKVWIQTVGGGATLTLSTPADDGPVCVGDMMLGEAVPR